jgi:hypothetical protein
VFQVAGNSPPRYIRFELHVTATPDVAYPDTNFTAVCGDPRLLLVDDDAGQTYERYYTPALDSNGVLYHTYSVQTSGSPSAETLRHYPVVIWFTGDDSTTTLTGADQASLTSFLSNGGKLMLCGQSIAQDIQSESFLADYLHARFLDDSTGKPYLPGIIGDPITDGDTMVLAGGGGANNAKSSDAVQPVGGAVGCAYFKDYADTAFSVIRYAGAYQLVFFPVAFEAVDHSTRYLQRDEAVKRILLWFGERIPGVAEQPPLAPDKRPYVLHIAPNPFRDRTNVEFIAPLSGTVELRAYTLNGRLVSSQTGSFARGERGRFDLDGSNLANGVYVVQLVTPLGVYAQKTAVLR